MDRQSVREKVFERDNYKCVCCGLPAVDAHHLLERRLWTDGGYDVDNLISVCAACHLKFEETAYSVEYGRHMAGITRVLVPDHLYEDQVYDKWGNPILPDGRRLRGELFEDESVQKILAPFLHLFTQYIKYPRTYHLPWSHPNKDDRSWSHSFRHKQEVVITEKLDGECTTLYSDYIHARSIDSNNHPSRGWVKNFWSKIAHDIPDDYRVCGENLYARHSIKYDDLETYFYGFSVWNGLTCLSWDDTLEWFGLLGITPVPTLYRGQFQLADIDSLNRRTGVEGYVIRDVGAFSYREFPTKTAKYVRENHVQTKARWKTDWEKNEVRSR